MCSGSGLEYDDYSEREYDDYSEREYDDYGDQNYGRRRRSAGLINVRCAGRDGLAGIGICDGSLVLCVARDCVRALLSENYLNSSTSYSLTYIRFKL